MVVGINWACRNAGGPWRYGHNSQYNGAVDKPLLMYNLPKQDSVVKVVWHKAWRNYVSQKTKYCLFY